MNSAGPRKCSLIYSITLFQTSNWRIGREFSVRQTFLEFSSTLGVEEELETLDVTMEPPETTEKHQVDDKKKIAEIKSLQ